MASIQKRGDKWRVFICKDGKRASKTFDTKSSAKHWANKTELELESGENKPVINYFVFEAFEKYANECSVKKKGQKWEVNRLKALARLDFAQLLLRELKPAHLAIFRDMRLNQVQASTVNRELNLISAVFSVAIQEWHWLEVNPCKGVKRPKNPKPRDRRISEDEIEKICKALGFDESEGINNKSQLVAAFFLLAIETAMRLGELCAVTCEDVFLQQRFLIIRDSKNSDTRQVPLSKRATELIEIVLNSGLCIGSGSATSLFKKGIKKTDIEGLTFHDTRHESLTRLSKKIDVLDLARMVGHRDLKSLMIYYNATASEIAKRLD